MPLQYRLDEHSYMYICILDFSGPIKPMILAQNDAINKWRRLMGPTRACMLVS